MPKHDFCRPEAGFSLGPGKGSVLSPAAGCLRHLENIRVAGFFCWNIWPRRVSSSCAQKQERRRGGRLVMDAVTRRERTRRRSYI
jgi:hypothetical protein